MTTREQVAALNSSAAEGVGLRVEFVRRGDRYGHRVVAVSPDSGAAVLIESIEGEPLDDWPASPALQALNADQLHKQDGPAALIGMSGSSHWSLTVEQSPASDGAGLVFDAACRAKAFPPQVGSRYRLAPGVALVAEEADSTVRLETGDRQWRLRTLGVDDQHAAPWSFGDGEWMVARGVDASVAEPRTVRWRYCVELI